MGLTLAKCPACGADLNLEIDRDFFYCPHCGSKVLKVDDRIVIEHVNRTIDEAEIRKIEFEREKHTLDEERIEKNRRENLPKAKKMMLLGLVIFAIGQIIDSANSSNMLGAGIWFIGGFLVIFGGATFLDAYIGSTNKNNSSNGGGKNNLSDS